MYYDASVTCFYCGMFSPMNGEPFKAYYSFKAFNELYKLKNRVECTASGSIKTLAASDGKKTAVLAVNESDRSKRVTLRRDGKPVPGMSVTVTDKRRTEAAKPLRAGYHPGRPIGHLDPAVIFCDPQQAPAKAIFRRSLLFSMDFL